MAIFDAVMIQYPSFDDVLGLGSLSSDSTAVETLRLAETLKTMSVFEIHASIYKYLASQYPDAFYDVNKVVGTSGHWYLFF